METVYVILIILILLALAGAIAFLIYDYLGYKDTTDASIADANKKIRTEGDTRLSNLKYVVEQVNKVNTDIYNTWSSNNTLLTNNLSATSNQQTRVQRGLQSVFDFTPSMSCNVSVPLIDLPGYANPDVRLIKHVTMVSGLTIKDIGTTSNTNVTFCSKNEPTRCIKFPDENGNTLLTSMASGSRVIFDTDTDVNGTLNLNTASRLQYGYLSSVPNATGGNDLQMVASSNIMMRPSATGKVAISTTNTAPAALLHVTSTDAATDVFRATPSNTANTVAVRGDGTLNVKKIQIGNTTIEASTDNNSILFKGNTGTQILTLNPTRSVFASPVTIPP